jgi:hypothetical protein
MVHNKNTLRILKGLENTKKNTNPNLVFKNLAYIIPLQTFRKTPNVEFLKINKVIDQLGAIDQVTHGKGAKSPMLPNDSNHYWYMHKYQKDQLIVHKGTRIVELYSKKYGRKETFEVSRKCIKHNGTTIFKGTALLCWPAHVFHRIHSPHGSVSTNYAKHAKGFSIKNNFNIYDLDLHSGNYKVVRKGFTDQYFT